MIGIVVQLIVSWLLIWLVEKKDLSVLGFAPSKERWKNLAFGLFAASAICCVYYQLIGHITGGVWNINEMFSFNSLVIGLWSTLKSVLFEELIFRGVLLYIVIHRFGVNTGCAISAVCFGIYHWFSYNVLGNPVAMAYVFVFTAIAGLMFAFSFAITRSLYLPVGLHYGWNFVSAVIFSNGPLGDQLLTLENESEASGILSLLASAFQLFALPLIVLWYLRGKTDHEESA